MHGESLHGQIKRGRQGVQTDQTGRKLMLYVTCKLICVLVVYKLHKQVESEHTHT